MASGRRKNEISSKKIAITLIVLLIIAVAIFFGVKALRSKVTEKYGNTDKDEITSAEVTVGSISTTVSGSGTLKNQDSDELSIPQSVDVSEIYVDAGDTVKAGDILASVNRTSVIETMADLQSDIDELDEEIKALEASDEVEEITSGVAGRVKKIYAEKDVSVASTMYENKALMLISLDGYMAIDIETEELKVGDAVTVVASDGTEYEGTVDSVWGGKTTVVVTDNGTTYGDTVTVKYGDDKSAEGTLYIHEQVAVTGYTGTVKAVKVSEEDKVKTGATLLTLTDSNDSVNYQKILKSREEKQETLQDLIVIYKEGAVYAKVDGLVTSITESSDSGSTTTTMNSSSMMFMNASGTTTTSSDDDSDTIIAISPIDTMTMVVSVDETDILSLSVGQTASVTISSLSDESFEGTLSKIDKVGTSSSGVTTYSATIEIARTDGMLEGMSASAVVTIEGKDDAILVPTDAVKKTSSTAYVYTSYDEETGELGDMVEITIGLSNSSYTEVTSGLSSGDSVYFKDTEDDNGFSFPGGGSFPGGNSDFPGGGSFPSGGSSGFPGGGSGGFSGGGFPGGN